MGLQEAIDVNANSHRIPIGQRLCEWIAAAALFLAELAHGRVRVPTAIVRSIRVGMRLTQAYGEAEGGAVLAHAGRASGRNLLPKREATELLEMAGRLCTKRTPDELRTDIDTRARVVAQRLRKAAARG